MALELNTKAPDFTWTNENDEKINFSNYTGKWIVLYFYPKDNTSGCTKEACDFRDNMERISSLDAVVLGISPDSIKSHKNFTEKFNLNFSLIPDPEKEICNLFNVMGEKSMYGRKYMGVIRSTFIISPDGLISKIYSNVKVDGHAGKVIEDLTELMK
jgi:peroxiredoxin Q/BCP